MDLNDYWQENKRFVNAVVGGGIVFLIAHSYLGGHFADSIDEKNRKITRYQRELAGGLYSQPDLGAAENDNEALVAAVDALEQHVAFRPREAFRLTEADVSPSNQYLRTLADVRDELLPRANRASLRIDEDFGMPKLSPTKPDEIERYLEALDVIATVTDAAIDARVRRIDKIQVRLDSGLASKAGVGRVERTRVTMSLIGDSVALARVLAATQRSSGDRALHIGQLEMISSKQRDGEVRLDVTFLVVRLHRETPGDPEQ